MPPYWLNFVQAFVLYNSVDEAWNMIQYWNGKDWGLPAHLGKHEIRCAFAKTELNPQDDDWL